jgi:hypothetical protein
MSSDAALIVAVVLAEDVVAALVFGVAAYWAFSIRRVVNNKYLRSQCVWLGTVSVGLIPVLPTPYSSNLSVTLYTDILFLSLLPLLILAWIDSTVRIDRRSDPLLRDALGWSRLRIGVWIMTVLFVVLPYIFLRGEIAGTVPAVLQTFASIAPYLPALIAGAPALLISARRSKNSVRRENVKWLGLFALFVLLSIFAVVFASIGVTAIPPGFFYFLAFKGIYILAYVAFEFLVIVAAYCLYRCAKSLAPLNRASEVEVLDN